MLILVAVWLFSVLDIPRSYQMNDVCLRNCVVPQKRDTKTNKIRVLEKRKNRRRQMTNCKNDIENDIITFALVISDDRTAKYIFCSCVAGLKMYIFARNSHKYLPLGHCSNAQQDIWTVKQRPCVTQRHCQPQ